MWTNCRCPRRLRGKHQVYSAHRVRNAIIGWVQANLGLLYWAIYPTKYATSDPGK